MGFAFSVNQEGQRIFDRNINRLTVVANESYEEFAKALQNEIEEDCRILLAVLKTRAKSKK